MIKSSRIRRTTLRSIISAELVWRNVTETQIIPVDPSKPFDRNILRDYDICVTGAAMKQYEHQPTFIDIIQHTWVYARVSPPQKEYILSTMKALGYITLMAGDGTNDVGALKQAHVGIALLNGSEDDLKKIAEHQKNERLKKVYEQQCKISARFNQPPPPVPAALKAAFPELVETQQQALASMTNARKKNPMEKVSLLKHAGMISFRAKIYLLQFDLASITDKMAEMDDENEPPKIKLGDASCAAPFTSKLANISAGKYNLSRNSRIFTHISCYAPQSPASSVKVDVLWLPLLRCS